MKNTTKTKAEVSPLFRNQKGVEYKTGILTVTDGVSELKFAFHAPYNYKEEAYKIITGYLDGWDNCYEAMVGKFFQCFDLATSEDIDDYFVGVEYNLKTDKVLVYQRDFDGEIEEQISGMRRDVVVELADELRKTFSRVVVDAVINDKINRKPYKEFVDALKAVDRLESFIRL